MGDNDLQNSMTNSNNILQTAPNTKTFDDIYNTGTNALNAQQLAINNFDASLSTIIQDASAATTPAEFGPIFNELIHINRYYNMQDH